MELFGPLGAELRSSAMEWVFPSGGIVKFAHIEEEKTVHAYQGMQAAMIGYDELVHFSITQFFYMLSRLRSMSGIPGYVRAATNPEPGWVADFIAWWINQETGFPIEERAGKLRYFIRRGDNLVWANSREELMKDYGAEQLPKSVTFIPSKVTDNKILLSKDKEYLSNLHALSRVDRMRLLEGNWKVRPMAGTLFRKEWFSVIDKLPTGMSMTVIRSWDRAASTVSELNPDPDWTVGLKLIRCANRTYVVADMIRFRESPLQVERFVKNTADIDGKHCSIGLEKDPGAAGICDIENYTRLLTGFNVIISRPSHNKVSRAKPVSAQCEAGNVRVLKGPWNDAFFTELENFGEDSTGHDDIVDALSQAYNELTQDVTVFDYFTGR
jgi:predicted phage terminase large subunit-like protein